VFITYGKKLPNVYSLKDVAFRLLTTNTEQFFLHKEFIIIIMFRKV